MNKDLDTLDGYIFRMHKCTYNSVLEKWNSIGMLDRLSDDNKILAANSFELTINYLLGSNDYNQDSMETTELAIIIFPIIHRVIAKVKIDINDLMLIIETTKKNIPNLVELINNNTNEKFDYEGRYCKKLSDEFILHIKNNKKE